VAPLELLPTATDELLPPGDIVTDEPHPASLSYCR